MQSGVKLFSFLASCGKTFLYVVSWEGGSSLLSCWPKNRKKKKKESRRLSSAHPSRRHQRSDSHSRETWTYRPAPCGSGYQACISLTNRLNLTYTLFCVFFLTKLQSPDLLYECTHAFSVWSSVFDLSSVKFRAGMLTSCQVSICVDDILHLQSGRPPTAALIKQICSRNFRFAVNTILCVCCCINALYWSEGHTGCEMTQTVLQLLCSELFSFFLPFFVVCSEAAFIYLCIPWTCWVSWVMERAGFSD